MRKTFLFLSFLIMMLFAKDYSDATINIVYPKKNGVTINAKSTFFVGSIPKNQKLYINSKEVKVSPSGAFAQYVELNKNGENKFILKSGNDEVKFVINKPFNLNCSKKAENFIETSISEYKTIRNTSLRLTPVDGGINRLSMLSKDTKLFVNGEQGDFARIYLCKDKFAWVLKKDIQLENCENDKIDFAKIKSIKRKKHKDFITYEIKFSNRVPFEIQETEKDLVCNFYNVKKLKDKFQIKYSNKRLIGYSYEYKHNKFILKIRQNIETEPTVVIDAGHGGSEKGAIGCGGIPEKEINLSIAKFVEKYLSEQNIKVLMTRKNDETISLKNRCDFANRHNANVLVSIHSNALPDGQNPLLNRGSSVYYYHPQAKNLAEILLNKLTNQANTQNDGIRQRSLALVRPTQSVSVLIEVGYMINPYDYDLLINEDFQKLCAKAISEGIIEYLNQ